MPGPWSNGVPFTSSQRADVLAWNATARSPFESAAMLRLVPGHHSRALVGVQAVDLPRTSHPLRPATLIDARFRLPLTRGVKGPEWRRATSYFSVVVMIALTAYLRVCPRPQSLPLETAIDGPNPATANRVVIWLHGRGGSIARTAELVKRLRDAGLPADVSIVLLEGPFPTLYGHAWGDGAREQAISRARVRARLAELLGARGHTPSRVMIAGFSQGAGLAGDVAAEEPRVQALASFSPCGFWLRAELPKRASLRVLLAHGKRDAVCPVEESRSLAAALTSAHLPVQYLEFDGEHTVPSAAVRALVTFASAL